MERLGFEAFVIGSWVSAFKIDLRPLALTCSGRVHLLGLLDASLLHGSGFGSN